MFHSKRRIPMEDYYKGVKRKWGNRHGEQSRGNSPNSLLLFCDYILKYENYKMDKEDDMDDETYSSSGSDRTSDSFSPLHDNSFEDKYSNEDRKIETDKDDSWNLITCYCLKPFRGRPMIECTLCGTWIHMSCAKIRQNNVPDIFVCKYCRKPKDNKRRSERIRSDDRRLA
ncbi:PHD finger protein 13 [Nephila pilipes]|uniref:PHD finger protein 13 n=1 Tax=Nephila pilipes TaxID=299642 RepID=A0A8X6N2W1_NEPPI|nr:PHD finger protein 13 [Nephila pilipes]